MPSRSTATTIDEYIAEFPPETQKVLQDLRALIRATVPETTERISYAIPTFDLDGRYLVYFAGFKLHVGLYPVTANIAAAFEKELKPYKRGKGSVQFPLNQPLPWDLLRRIVEFMAHEHKARAPK